LEIGFCPGSVFIWEPEWSARSSTQLLVQYCCCSSSDYLEELLAQDGDGVAVGGDPDNRARQREYA
jgi:hypothetical protein